ncbi:MAG: SPOR domain-containing protein [Desulfovibrio sp.]|uniref:SPOR domain-containing protein n=1 Tax=Desulfovibrio sp. 7SRBS1 TaxID=3378064 RepID=UPI003B40FAF9
MAFLRKSNGKSDKNGKAKKNSEAKQPRKFTLELSPGGLIAAGFGALLCLIWVFILGVLLGRGYRPENDVPELSKLIPEPPAAKAVAEQPKPEDRVLKAVELDYMKSLHQKSPNTVRDMKPSPKPEPKPKPKAEPAKAQKASQPAPAVQKASAPATPTPQKGMFNYVYQVAAFQDKLSAHGFANTLKDRGLHPASESVKVGQKTWYRVLVHFRGKPADTAHLKSILAELGVNKIIMRSKKPL